MEAYSGSPEAMMIGGAIADILLRPVDASVFAQGSTAVDSIRMSVGGDALNESTVLARLGHVPLLVTRLGMDGVAEFILSHCAREGVQVCAARQDGLDTGINAVLVSPSGERSFVTNRNGSLRKLDMKDVEQAMSSTEFDAVRLVCLASMFVSPVLELDDMETLFARAKACGKIVCADTTRPKKGETLRDAAAALRHLDYFFPNLEEARTLTGLREPEMIADALLDAGVGCVALKLGGEGCLLKCSQGTETRVPCYPVAQCVDTTGAGDTFAGAFIAALLENRSPVECAAYANAAASVCVESLGATTARMDRAEVMRRFEKILQCFR